MLDKYGLNEETKELAIKLMIDERNEYSHGGLNTSYCLTAKHRGGVARANFFRYIDDLSQKYGEDFVRNFITNALSDVSANFDAYEGMNRHAKTNFVNLFLREVVEAFPQDVKIEMGSGKHLKDWGASGTNFGNLEATIAGVTIGHLHFEDGKTNVNNIQFTDFRTLSGLERLGLGTHMFSEFCRLVEEHKPGYTLLAFNVAKGRDGEAAYTRWGAYPTNSYRVQGYDFYFDEKPLTQEEYNVWQANMFYYFNQDVVHSMAETRSSIYAGDNGSDILE